MVLEGMCEVCVEVMFVCKHWLWLVLLRAVATPGWDAAPAVARPAGWDAPAAQAAVPGWEGDHVPAPAGWEPAAQ